MDKISCKLHAITKVAQIFWYEVKATWGSQHFTVDFHNYEITLLYTSVSEEAEILGCFLGLGILDMIADKFLFILRK